MCSQTVQEFDFMIVGSSLSNALLTNVLSWSGFSVLSLDENEYYGDYTAALSLEELCAKYDDIRIQDSFIDENKRKFGLDLVPSYILCESKMIKYIMNFNIYRYLEVVKLDSFYTYDSSKQQFNRLKTTKQDVFTDTSITPITKRTIMKCIKFLVEENRDENDVWKEYGDKSVMDLFKEKFSKLPENLVNEFVFTICGASHVQDLTTQQAGHLITKFFKSYNVYGNFPALLTKYGGLGELIQGIYRSAALIGNVLRLGTCVKKLDGNVVELSDGEKFLVREKIIVSNYQTTSLKNMNIEPRKEEYHVHRASLIVKQGNNDSLKWAYSDTNGSLVTFPPGSVLSPQETPLTSTVQALVMADSLERTPSGYATVSIVAANKPDLDIVRGKFELESDVRVTCQYRQDINKTPAENGAFVLVAPDVQDPLSLDLDHHVDAAIALHSQLLHGGDGREHEFMAVNLPANDE